MGWETRNGHFYYYRKRRIGERVVSDYVGGGETAALIVAREQAKRDEQKRREHDARAEISRVDAMLAAHRAYADLTTQLATAALLSEGYRSHRGQWRKRRGEQE